MLAPITYNRSTKMYDVAHDLKTLSFHTREKAIMCTVAIADKRVYADVKVLVEQWGILETRAWKAAQLYLNGHVFKHDNHMTVRSQRNTETYTIKAFPAITECDCRDHAQGAGKAPIGPGERRWCKHMLACVYLHRFGPQHIKQVNHNGRTIQQPVTTTPKGYYQNGQLIDRKLINYDAIYRSRTGQAPPSREALAGWVNR